MRHYLSILFTLLFLNPLLQLKADTVDLDAHFTNLPIGTAVSFFEDKSNSYTFDYLLKHHDRVVWRASNQNYLNFGFTDTSYWLYGKINNLTQISQYLVIDLGDSLIDNIDIYLVRENGEVELTQLGTRKGGEGSDSISKWSFATGFNMAGNESIEFYIRLKTQAFLQTKITLWQTEYFISEQSDHKLLVSLFTGIFLMMICFLIFLYIHLREAQLLQYILFIFCYVGVIWLIKGFGFVDDFPFIAQHYDALLIILMGIISWNLSLLAPRLLKLKHRPWFILTSTFVTYASIAVVFSPLFLSFQASIIVISLLVATLTVILLISSLFYIHDRSKQTRFYVFSLVYFILGMDLYMLNRYGLLGYNEFTEYTTSLSAILVLLYLCWNFSKQMAYDRKTKNKVQQQIMTVNERYYSVFQNAAEGMFTTSLDGTILAINKSMCRLLGFSDLNEMQLHGITTANGFYIDPDLRDKIIARLLAEEQVTAVEMTGVDRYGDIFHGEINMRLNVQPAMTIIDGSFVDTTKRRQHEIKLETIAKYDQLTGLVNRSHFEKLVSTSLATAKTEMADNILLYLDLDQFKLVNDICGHDVGDALLKKITILLRSYLTSDTILARLGGDEFAILLERSDMDKALEVADLIRTGIEAFRYTHHGRHFVLGVSIGIVMLDSSIGNSSLALSLADTACFTAKTQGRNRVYVYSKSNAAMLTHQREMRWIGVLREALDQNRFELAFQTISPLTNPVAEGYRYEVLLRLRDEQGKLQSPSEFIAAAEKYNFMVQLDRWVVQTFCQWLASNPKHLQKLTSASINLCGQSLIDRGMHKFIEETIERYAIPPHKLCFEVTESQAIVDFEQTIIFMHKFKELGCRFSLDDFGSGFSSYSYIKRLPIDQLKIDGAFVQNIETNNIDYTMVKSFNEIAKAVNIKTVAEYVENENIKNILAEIGIDFVQGYLIAKPALLVDLVDNELFDSA